MCANQATSNGILTGSLGHDLHSFVFFFVIMIVSVDAVVVIIIKKSSDKIKLASLASPMELALHSIN